MPRISSNEYAVAIETISDLTAHALSLGLFVVFAIVVLYVHLIDQNKGKLPLKLFYKNANYYCALGISFFVSNTIFASLYRLFDVEWFVDAGIFVRLICALVAGYLFCWVVLAICHVSYSLKGTTKISP